MKAKAFSFLAIIVLLCGCGANNPLSRGTGGGGSTLNEAYFTANIQPVITSNCSCHETGTKAGFSYFSTKVTAGNPTGSTMYTKASALHSGATGGIVWSAAQLTLLSNWINGSTAIHFE